MSTLQEGYALAGRADLLDAAIFEAVREQIKREIRGDAKYLPWIEQRRIREALSARYPVIPIRK